MVPTLSLITLWVYVTLLMVGGIIGRIKAGSNISLLTSAIFAFLLALCALGIVRPFYIADILIGLLAVFFVYRFIKTRKFMPSGMLIIFSLVVLAVLLVNGR